MVVLFMDKAAFDSVDRKILLESMRKRGVKGGLVVRCEEMLKETVSRVKVGEKEGERFWTDKGPKQRCPLSPCLFTHLLADLDEVLEKEDWGKYKSRWKKNILFGVCRSHSGCSGTIRVG